MANEKRLIDANALMDSIIDQLEHEWGYEGIREDVKRIFENAPTVDAVEVVHARWIEYESDEAYGPYDSKEWYKCSNCGEDAYGRCYDDEWYSSPVLSDYCPFCGAKMDGGNEDG